MGLTDEEKKVRKRFRVAADLYLRSIANEIKYCHDVLVQYGDNNTVGVEGTTEDLNDLLGFASMSLDDERLTFETPRYMTLVAHQEVLDTLAHPHKHKNSLVVK